MVQCQRALAMNSTMLACVRHVWSHTEHGTLELYCVGNGHKVKSATIEFNDKFKMTFDHTGASFRMSSHTTSENKKSEMDIRHLLNQFLKLRMSLRRTLNKRWKCCFCSLQLCSATNFCPTFCMFFEEKNRIKNRFQFLRVKWENQFLRHTTTIRRWCFVALQILDTQAKNFNIEFFSFATFCSLSFVLVWTRTMHSIYVHRKTISFICCVVWHKANWNSWIYVWNINKRSRTNTIHNNYYATDVNHKFQFKQGERERVKGDRANMQHGANFV